jgi:hypothetical protein
LCWDLQDDSDCGGWRSPAFISAGKDLIKRCASTIIIVAMI